jgi:hypothetical protein
MSELWVGGMRHWRNQEVLYILIDSVGEDVSVYQ